jgi:hypothetical protein
MAHHYHEDESRNRVLVGLPARLEAARSALRESEKTLEELRQLYGQRLLLKDSVVLDQMGDLLGCPHIEGDKPEVIRIEVDRGQNCPACTGGNGPFCTAHDWHNS